MAAKNEHGLTGPQEEFAKAVASGKPLSEAHRLAYPKSVKWAGSAISPSAGIALRPRDAQLPADLVVQLQRCDGFSLFGLEHGLGFRVCKDLLLPDGHIEKIGGVV